MVLRVISDTQCASAAVRFGLVIASDLERVHSSYSRDDYVDRPATIEYGLSLPPQEQSILGR